MLLSLSITALAASYTGDDVKPGLSGIQPGDELTHPENTDWATLTAIWGVRVTFVDWDESELKNELVPVTDTMPGSSHAPEDPTRSGYTFTGWERHDTNGDTNVTLNDDGSVTNVTGPGPIVYIATYTRNPIGSLSVTKIISGRTADRTKAFEFTVTLGDSSINGTYGALTFTDGVASFTLTGDQTKTATGLPAGISFTVTEADYSADGYVTAMSGDTGTIEDGKTSVATFTNTKIPKTGDNSNITLWLSLTGVSVIGMIGTLFIKTNKRRKAAHLRNK